jgi:hypothetical protein
MNGAAALAPLAYNLFAQAAGISKVADSGVRRYTGRNFSVKAMGQSA